MAASTSSRIAPAAISSSAPAAGVEDSLDRDPSTAPASPSDAPQTRLAVAYSPQVVEPETLARVDGGNFVISLSPGSGEYLVIRPGLNLAIDPQQWQAAQSLPAVQELFGIGALEEIEVCVTSIRANQVLGDINISRTEMRQALRLVHLCQEPARLREWAAAEDRPSIRNAALQRATQLEAGQG